MDIKEIRTLIDLMKKNGVAVFKMEREGFKITLKTAGAVGPTQYVTSQPVFSASEPASPPPANHTEAPAAAPPAAEGLEIKSPMVGTYYSAASPESPAFLSVGQQVTPDTVICIIEAMKLFNEIEAEISGKIVKVLVDDASPVEYDQPLFLVDPA